MRHESPSILPVPVAPISARTLLAAPELEDVLTVIVGEAQLQRSITHARIQKSGLVMAGHLVGVVPTRIQVLGETELSYLETLEPDLREERLRAFFGLGLSCVIVTRGVEAPTELRDAALATSTPLLLAGPRSSATIAALHLALDRLLAPRESLHGVMVDVHGIGILLVGPSGIGKSECALFLVERGHRLVADDRVELVRLPGGRIIGNPPPLLKHHLEIRGLGILNVRDLFGATAVRSDAALHLVAELCAFQQDEEYERLGLDDMAREVLGVPIPLIRVPVNPGRNMAVLLEVAARNQLLKNAGHHAARAFAERLARGGPLGPDGAG